MKELIIVVDYGTSNVRVNAIDPENGAIILSESKKYAINDKGAGYAEISADHLWEYSVDCMRKVVGTFGADTECSALSFSFFGDNLIPVDSDGNALNDCILCMDARGTEEMKEINEKIPREKQISIIGDWYSMPYKFGTKAAWIKKHGAQREGKIVGYDSLQQYIFRKLGLPPVNDYTMAVRKQICDIVKLQWSEEFLDAVGLTEDEVGKEIITSDSVVGYIGKYGDVEFQHVIPVIAGGHDCDMAMIGMGLIHENTDCIGDVIGTFDHVGYVSENMFNVKKEQPGTELFSSRGAKGSLMNVLGALPMAGTTLEWFMREVNGNTDQKAYQELWSRADFDGENQVVLYPSFDSGKGKIEGLGMTTTKMDLFKAVIEALTFENRRLIEICERSREKEVLGVRVCGGGSVSDEWMQLRADISGKRIERMRNIQSSSLGSAVLSAVKVGIYPNLDEAVKYMVHVDKVFVPDRQKQERYCEKYKEYIKRMGYAS